MGVISGMAGVIMAYYLELLLFLRFISKQKLQLNEILDKPILHKFIVSNDLSTRHLDEDIVAIPAVQFLT